jgi:hypothetical protein
MPEERRQQRLQAWVERELRSLLQTDDVAIVRAYVMGLVCGIGFAGRATNGGGRGSEHHDAAAALRPFLQEHAEHFWHELRCLGPASTLDLP